MIFNLIIKRKKVEEKVWRYEEKEEIESLSSKYGCIFFTC